ncbi:MAG: poly-gamma-glutamate biosynthesis protein PgsC [Spirochaetales bacterium]|nr:poly-gamma-glutamate biosynthesis protein PgsC [Spirochaetales bacterium]
MFETFIALSIIASLIYYETTDISPGGLITPGYLALFIDQPQRLLATLVIASIVYALILLLKKILPLYGRRQYALAISAAVLIKLLLSDLIISGPQFSVVINSVGVIVPGLIANDMAKQSAGRTLLSVIIVTVFLFAVLVLLKGAAV